MHPYHDVNDKSFLPALNDELTQLRRDLDTAKARALNIEPGGYGLVLRNSLTLHYWRVSVDGSGTLVVTDLGLTRP